MRKVFINKWFILASLLTITLSLFSFMAYKKAQPVCTASAECCKKTLKDVEKGGMFWDLISGQLSTVSFQ
jgi:hypothetical protein